MSGNSYLHNANKSKKDEFYTQLSDIEKELKHYKEQLKDKVIFCNCDDPEYSNFWRYFELNFEHIGIKKLIATHYETDKPSYKLELIKDETGLHTTRVILKQNGDFRSPECIEILKTVDVVITNPPFSLFREYISQLMEYGKKFIVIGNQNSLTYKEIFPLVKDNRMWLGYGFNRNCAHFINKYYEDTASDNDHRDGLIRVSGVVWFTNIETEKRHENLILYRTYNEEDYPRYENYDAINVNQTKDIPMDYDGVIGVPITFIDKYNPDQFEIVALGIVGSCEFTSSKKMELLDKDGNPTGKFTINAKGTLYRKYNPEKDKKPAFKDAETGQLYSSIYARILIKKKVVASYEN